MKSIWIWLKAKFGRITTLVGAGLQLIETLDISEIKQPLEDFIGHKGVQAIVIGLFLLSFARHQWVASQHKEPPPPDDGK